MVAVKQEPRSITQQSKQEEVGSSMQNRRSSSTKVAVVNQETNSFTQPATAATCKYGGTTMRCSAPGCHQLYCQPCDKTLKAHNPAKGFRSCSFFCCMPRAGFTKFQFCASHSGLLFKCTMCQEVFCERLCCNQCKLAVCKRCIDDHEEASCSGRLHRERRLNSNALLSLGPQMCHQR